MRTLDRPGLSDERPLQEDRNPFDRFVDPVAYKGQGIHEWSGGAWRSCRERYVEDGWRLHLHVWGATEPIRETKPQDFCIAFEWPETKHELLRWDISRSKVPQAEFDSLKDGPGYVEHSVLVPIGEFVKLPEWTPGVLPCRKWLRTLYNCETFIADAFEHAPSPSTMLAFRPEPITIQVNRKTGTAVGYPLVAEDKLPDRMVERRAEVVDYLPSEDTPHWIDLRADLDSEGDLPSVIIEIDEKTIRAIFKEPRDLFAERVELLFAPRELESWSLQRIADGADHRDI